MKLLIDGREDSLYGNIWTLLKLENFPYLKIEKKELPLDVIFYDEDYSIAFERKERNDFVSSIMDKRIINQAIEMQNYDERYMIIEGNVFSTFSDILPKAIAGMLCSLTYKYDIKILPSPNSRMTAYMILNLVRRRINKEKPTLIKQLSQTSDNIFATMLTAIPNISLKRAEIIVKDFEINSLTDFSKLTKLNFKTLKSKHKLSGIGKIFENISNLNEKGELLEKTLDENYCPNCNTITKEKILEHGVRICSKCGYNLEVIPKVYLKKVLGGDVNG